MQLASMISKKKNAIIFMWPHLRFYALSTPDKIVGILGVLTLVYFNVKMSIKKCELHHHPPPPPPPMNVEIKVALTKLSSNE